MVRRRKSRRHRKSRRKAPKRRSIKRKSPKRKKRHISASRKSAFLRGRKAALNAGWKPFTKMSKTQKAAFRKAYHG